MHIAWHDTSLLQLSQDIFKHRDLILGLGDREIGRRGKVSHEPFEFQVASFPNGREYLRGARAQPQTPHAAFDLKVIWERTFCRLGRAAQLLQVMRSEERRVRKQ